MTTENIEKLTDDQIINVINTIFTDDLDVDIADLKKLLSEVSARKLEPKYINVIADKIKSINDREAMNKDAEDVVAERKAEMEAEIEQQVVEDTVVVEPILDIEEEETPKERKRREKKEKAEEKPTFDEIYADDDEDDDEDEELERYPILSFLVGFFKVVAWVLLVLSIVTGVCISAFSMNINIFQVCGIMFGSLLAGVIFLILFYSMSENIMWKLDVAEMLKEKEEN